MTRHLLVDTAYLLDMKPRPVRTPRLEEGDEEHIERMIIEAGFKVLPHAKEHVAALRDHYEGYLGGLQRNLFVDIPPFCYRLQQPDSWQTSAWDNTAHF